MVNNFEQIKSLMEFPNKGDFYFIQILQRKKDNATKKNGNNNSRLVKAYYISDLEQLDMHKDEMISLCTTLNARAYVNLNRRNYEKCSLQTARLILDQIANKDHKSAKKAFNTICGRYHSDSDKKWLIDVDNPEIDHNDLLDILKVRAPVGVDKFIAKIPTKNGYHLIIKPFNTEGLKFTWLDKMDIHKNNPTILYVP